MLNCKWKDKLGKYSEKVFKHLVPYVEKTKSPFVGGYALQSLKYWKTTMLGVGNNVADKVINETREKNPWDLIQVFKYGIRTIQTNYTQPAQDKWDSLGFLLSEKETHQLISWIKNEDLSSCLDTLNQNLNPTWRDESLLSSLHSDEVLSTSISKDSKLISLNYEDKSVYLFGLSYQEETLSSLVELIDREKIQNIALPFLPSVFTEANPTSSLESRLKNPKYYKLFDVHKMVVTNVFGVKSVDIPWTLVHRKPDAHFVPLYPSFDLLRGLWQDFTDVEAAVRTCMLIDSCRILNEVEDKGCYLCSKHRIFPIPYQDFAVYSAQFAPEFVNHIGIQLKEFIKSSKENALVVLPLRLVYPAIHAMINPKDPLQPGRELDEENEMLLKMFFGQDK